jgi:hypothetical protein
MGLFEILLAYIGVGLGTSLVLALYWSMLHPGGASDDDLAAFAGVAWPFTITILLGLMSAKIVRSLNAQVRRLGTYLRSKRGQ